jgi:CheY-like chemotaxis protein
MVVEDEILVRSVTAEYLRTNGYIAIEAANASEAVSILLAGAPVDLVMSDIEMPSPDRMNGIGLARWIAHNHPEIPVILTSGRRRSAGEVGAPVIFLRKPYHLPDLVRWIETLLQAPLPP